MQQSLTADFSKVRIISPGYIYPPSCDAYGREWVMLGNVDNDDTDEDDENDDDIDEEDLDDDEIG